MVTEETVDLKARVRAHWEGETCGTRYGVSASRQHYFAEIERTRYRLEPSIPEFAGFAEARGKRVLEIGVGVGTDFYHWVRNGAIATGVDLTDAAIRLTRERLDTSEVDAFAYDLRRADAENLPFPEGSFDTVYSWGVLHHTPNTELAFQEAFRVLKPGGVLKAMVYHIPSWTGALLWLQHGLARGKPWRPVRDCIYHCLESPGTKAYTLREMEVLLSRVGFGHTRLSTRLGPGDLLTIRPSTKYRSPLFRIVWRLYPRWLVRLLGDRFGLALLIEAHKGAGDAR